MRIKLLIAAAALACASHAQAAISTGSGTAMGDLFLVAWDPVRGKSYARDLDIDGDTFVATLGSATGVPVTFGVVAGDLWTTFLGGTGTDQSGTPNPGATDLANVRWNIASAKNIVSGTNFTRALFTADSDLDYPSVTNSGLAGTLSGNVNGFGNLVNGTGCATALSCVSFNPADGGNGNSSGWSGTFGFFPTDISSGGVGDTLEFLFLQQNGTGLSNNGRQVTKSWQGNSFGEGSWSINAATGDVVWATAVPEPSSWALMGAGLLLVGAIARRRLS